MQRVLQPVRVELHLKPELSESRAQNFLASSLLHMKSLRTTLSMKVYQSRFMIIIL